MKIQIDCKKFEVRQGDNGFMTVAFPVGLTDNSQDQAEHLVDCAIEIMSLYSDKHKFMHYLKNKVSNYFDGE